MGHCSTRERLILLVVLSDRLGDCVLEERIMIVLPQFHLSFISYQLLNGKVVHLLVVGGTVAVARAFFNLVVFVCFYCAEHFLCVPIFMSAQESELKSQYIPSSARLAGKL